MRSRVDDWFPKSQAMISMAFEEDADLFSKLLAATSPISTIETNIEMAIRAYRHLKWFGEIPRTGFIEVHYVSIKKFLNGNHSTIGRKVYSLYQNLIGNEYVCPIDRWILRYFGYDNVNRVNTQLYNTLEDRIKTEAAVLGITPAERQVQIWCKQRGDPTSYGDIIERRELCRKNILQKLL